MSNYVRQLAMPARTGFAVRIRLRSGQISVPATPVDVPPGAYFIWPFNLKMQEAVRQYSTAQLLTRVATADRTVFAFFSVPGIAPVFAFAPDTVRSIEAPGATVSRSAAAWTVTGLSPGRASSVAVVDRAGRKMTILLLSALDAERCSVLHLGDREFLVLSSSTVFLNGRELHLRSQESSTQEVSSLPALPLSDAVAGTRDGPWTKYRFARPSVSLAVRATQVRAAAPREAMAMGPFVDWRKGSVAEAPPDSAFATAAEWTLEVPAWDRRQLSNLLLEIDYRGDVGRIEAGGRLFDDNFFNGQPWEVGLRELPPEAAGQPLRLRVLPMPRIAPIYLDEHARTILAQSPAPPGQPSFRLIPEYETVLELRR